MVNNVKETNKINFSSSALRLTPRIQSIFLRFPGTRDQLCQAERKVCRTPCTPRHLEISLPPRSTRLRIIPSGKTPLLDRKRTVKMNQSVETVADVSCNLKFIVHLGFEILDQEMRPELVRSPWRVTVKTSFVKNSSSKKNIGFVGKIGGCKLKLGVLFPSPSKSAVRLQ